jgi:amino acid permease
MKIRFNNTNNPYSGVIVPQIKAIRAVSGLGLKDAKDLFDLSMKIPVIVDALGSQNVIEEFVREMRANGATVETSALNYKSSVIQLRELITICVLKGHDLLAEDLLAVAKRHSFGIEIEEE